VPKIGDNRVFPGLRPLHNTSRRAPLGLGAHSRLLVRFTASRTDPRLIPNRSAIPRNDTPWRRNLATSRSRAII
jgi:hypothetical protein